MKHSLPPESAAMRPAFRWPLVLLTWLAFGISAYLAWKSIDHSPIAGCGGGDVFDCDVVHNSPWSVWLGVPVALGGLACYAALAGLSVLLGIQSPRASRWIATLFVLLATIAAGAGIWFSALQFAVIRKICLPCMAVHMCGLAIAGLVLASEVVRRRSAGSAGPGFAALQTALRAKSPTPMSAATAQSRQPRIGLALAGACAALALLIAGQILFPAKTFEIQTVALDQPIDLSGAQSHVAMRIPSEQPAEVADTAAESGSAARPLEVVSGDDTESSAGEEAVITAGHTEAIESDAIDAAPPEGPPRERLITFLGGKLTLDTYKHPILGSPEAPHVIVELVSYDCPHCRKMHRIVNQGMRRYGNQLAVLVLPIPLEMACNKTIRDPRASHRHACATARLALGVASIDPPAFRKFHDWLMADEEKVLPFTQSFVKARELVDGDRLREFTGGEPVNAQIQEYIDLFTAIKLQHAGANRSFGLPIQILGGKAMSGASASAEEIFQAWEEHLGIERP